MKITSKSLADIEFQLSWDSGGARHEDAYFGHNVNFWRDIFPAEMFDQIIDKAPGARLEFDYSAGEVLPARDDGRSLKLGKRQFAGRSSDGTALNPAVGRFYPRGFLNGVTGVSTPRPQTT